MELPKPFPTAGTLLALIACGALIGFGVEWVQALTVLIVWVGSLLLVSSRPPDVERPRNTQPFTRDNMRDLIENSSSPLLVTEANKVVIANRAARQILGVHVEGQDTRVAFRQPEAVAMLSQNRNGSAVIRGLVRRRDIWRINRQTIGGDLAVIELINKTAETDISRAHTDFVANASHELRTPLAAIIGYVETLRESDATLDQETRLKFLDTILREAKRLQNLVSDLMSLSKIEAEKHDQPEELIDLSKFVERAARDAAGPERVERLDLSLAPGITVRGDQAQLEQLVRNLVDNALKYGYSDTQVGVQLDITPGGHARLAVSDQGEGIAADHIPHLTRRFYRTDPGRSRASGGTGLGLAIVKHIVERHRGRLDIASEPGKGTCVTVRIPIEPDNTEGSGQ